MIQPTRRNVLNLSPPKLLILLACALTSGCIVVVDDYEREFGPYDGYTYSIWFNDADVYCEYDTTHQRSTWTVVASPDTSYGEDEIEDVYVEILGSYVYSYQTYFLLTPQGNGEWRRSFDNQGPIGAAYHCASSYYFEFTAYDYDGYYGSTGVEW
mgnify:FL=1|jgi:hypothetical protein